MTRFISFVCAFLLPASAFAQEAAECEPEVATVTIEIPTGRCATPMPEPPQNDSLPLAPPAQPAPYGAMPQYGAPYPQVQYGYAQMPYAIAPPIAPAQPRLSEHEYQERELRGLWIAGVAAFGAGYILSAVMTGAFDSEWGFVPIVGPWAELAEGGEATDLLWMPLGIAQIVGLVLTVVGATVRRRIPVEEPRLRFGAAPVQGGGMITLSSTF